MPLHRARRRAVLAVLVLVALCLELTVLAAPAAGTVAAADADLGDPDPDEPVADEPDADEPDAQEVARQEAEAAARGRLRDAEQQVARARAALREARAAVATARGAGATADGAVRRAEEELPPAVLARISLAIELTMSRHELRALHATRAELERTLADAEEALASQVLRTFKTGHASELTGPVAVLREARDPGELARGLADLRSVTRSGVRAVQEVEADLGALELQIAAAGARIDQLEADVRAARTALELAEEVAADARAIATEREAAVVTAMEAAVVAERAYRKATTLRSRRQDAVAEVEGASPAGSAGDARAEAGDAEDSRARGGAGRDQDDRTSAEDRRAEDRRDAEGRESDEGDEGPDSDTPRIEEGTPLEVRAREAAGRRRAYERATRLAPVARRTADAWACPFDDARFVNDWAFPRSGARRHEGTDVFGARGTPIVAVAAGTVTVLDPSDGRGDLGGITVTISQDDARQYYAHLERIEPTLRRGDEVQAGDRIGWVGTSGNARGTPPHLHLGWYVEDVAVNPYASLAVACAGRSSPVRASDVHPDTVESALGAEAGRVGPRSRVN